MRNKTVVLAMSGGVDSSVAAYILRKQGLFVIGITMGLLGAREEGPDTNGFPSSLEAARESCSRVGIPHYFIDCSKRFETDVIGRFIDSYRRGETPNPCIVCNEAMKFPVLIEQARRFNADYIATGHYARCRYGLRQGRFFIKEAKDKDKDQSYVLFCLGQDVLSRLKLPVGDYKKSDIYSIAKRLGLSALYNDESQEICFVQDNDLKRFLRDRLGGMVVKGIVKDAMGKKLSSHEGTCFFTIGQRRGIGVAYGSPIYVTDIDHKTGDITVGNYDDTLRQSLRVKNAVYTMPVAKLQKNTHVYVKIRYKHPKARAVLKIEQGGNALVYFKKPQNAPTPGQAAVFYKGDLVIGGGWII
ncbi:MAG: tRNA 2-thiouridine(34) synthase MnmA [Candidatus Omnitrophota bacterium]|jgi:tRNA-specific 2-thiouridylase